MNEQQITDTLDAVAAGFAGTGRAPVLGTPQEIGLDYEDVTFPATDGVPLEGWFIPAAENSGKLVVANHPMGFTRTGLPSHLEPWRSLWAASGNDIEVDFMPDYKILHDAGYHVLTYDLRNHGLSGSANGGVISSGIFESRDVIGSIAYARARTDTRSMKIGLFSRCLGADATFYAARQRPDVFEDLRCVVAAQPVTTKVIVARRLGLMGITEDYLDDLDRRIQLTTGIGFDAQDPVPWAAATNVPTFLYQVRDDILTTPDDVQNMYDAMPATQKRLHWITGTSRRWDGYLEFQRNPQPMLDWYADHMN
ncbi:alpha/beta hydrolase [Streptomyces nigra]|uniref:alpha/beta hydrolase n=1 Tax=Streptomyces nigra TaxID=1827580 RepID=UPI00368820B3